MNIIAKLSLEIDFFLFFCTTLFFVAFRFENVLIVTVGKTGIRSWGTGTSTHAGFQYISTGENEYVCIALSVLFIFLKTIKFPEK